MFTNFRMVLPVNNSLIRRVQPASSWPYDVSLDMLLLAGYERTLHELCITCE